MMCFNAFAWKWAESKYISYLDNDIGFVDADAFFEEDNKGELNRSLAESNIFWMKMIMNKYGRHWLLEDSN